MRFAPEGTTSPPVFRHPNFWRDNLEGILGAIVLVLILRHFAFEVFKIPTGSMASSLLGQHQRATCPNCALKFDVDAADRNGIIAAMDARCPNCGKSFEVRATRLYPPLKLVARLLWNFKRGINGGNRIIVNKFERHFKPPQRWHVIVFVPPHENKNYIKRLVGLPGEAIEVRHGDVFANGELLRKPDYAQREMWQLVHDSRFIPRKNVRGTAPWTKELGRFQLSGTPKEDLPVQGGDAAALRLIPGESRRARVRYAIPIYDFAAYNRITQPKGAAVIVGDLKWDVNVTLQDVGALHLHLHEDGVRYEAVIPFGRKEMRAELLKDGMPLHSDRFSGEPGREYRLSFSNVDDRLTLMVDGRRILVHDVAASKGSPNMQGATSAALLEADGAEAVFSRVRLFRDLYYTHPVDRGLDAAWDSPAGPWKVPQGHYLVLGDNTRKSSDSRMWGTIPEEELIGTAVVVWWPLQYLRPFQRE